MDLGDDRGIDLGRLAVAATRTTPLGRGLSRIADRALVDPLLEFTRLDLRPFEILVARRTWAATRLHLGGSTLGLGARWARLGPG